MIKSINLKTFLALMYFLIISTGMYFLFSKISLSDLTSFEFIKTNKDIILNYKNENFLFLNIIFFIFTIIWTLSMLFLTPLLLLSGFMFGKWWGILFIVLSTTIGATILYIIGIFFLRNFILEKLSSKFSKLSNFFNKNDILYFMFFRFVGGAGTPFPIQNLLPVLFNMPIKNYFIATLLGNTPPMFVTVAIGSGIEEIIEKNETLSFSTVLLSQEIYIPIFIFFVILFTAFVIKKFYLKQ